MEKPEVYVKAVKVAVRRTRELGVSDIRVHATWQLYRHLLAYKGIEWQPTNPDGLEQVKVGLAVSEFDGHPITLSAKYAPQVLGVASDGSAKGFAISN